MGLIARSARRGGLGRFCKTAFGRHEAAVREYPLFRGFSGLIVRALIDLDPDRLDDGAPFIDFRFEESLKLSGRRAHHHVAGLFQLALDHGIGESCDGIDTYLPDDLLQSWSQLCLF
jgi:hypothetical protein